MSLPHLELGSVLSLFQAYFSRWWTVLYADPTSAALWWIPICLGSVNGSGLVLPTALLHLPLLLLSSYIGFPMCKCGSKGNYLEYLDKTWITNERNSAQFWIYFAFLLLPFLGLRVWIKVTCKAELLALGCSLHSWAASHWEQEYPFKIISVTIHVSGEIPDCHLSADMQYHVLVNLVLCCWRLIK